MAKKSKSKTATTAATVAASVSVPVVDVEAEISVGDSSNGGDSESTPSLIREPSARESLIELIAARRNTPFAWGSQDCCLFAFDAIKAQTGTDLVSEYRGTYTDEEGAANLLGDKGGLRGVMGLYPELTPISVANAKHGDIVLISNDGMQESLGVCLGASIASPGKNGLAIVPTSRGLAAWAL